MRALNLVLPASWAVVMVACGAGRATAPPGSTSDALTGIGFPGSGQAGQGDPIAAGFTPNSCGVAGVAATMPVPGSYQATCYFASQNPATPLAFVERVVETAEGQGLVHVRLTMNPDFVDNTYGSTAIGWGSGAATPSSPAMPGGAGAPPAPGPAGPSGSPAPMPPAHAAMMPPMGGPGGHTFKDLVGSDHAEFDLSDRTGAVVMSFDLDYISADSGAPSGYATLGVLGGDGKMLTGSAADVIHASTSLDRDLNACGYASYTTDSPATDASYTPSAAAPNWDYRVVYDVWVNEAAFAAGFGAATIPYVHASPSKTSATIPVKPGPCPPAPDAGCSNRVLGESAHCNDVDGSLGCVQNGLACGVGDVCCTGVCTQGLCVAPSSGQ